MPRVARPERPDAAPAELLQEILAGQASETTAMMQYLHQGCNCGGPAKYRDMPAAGDPVVHAVMDGIHPQHFVTAGPERAPERPEPLGRAPDLGTSEPRALGIVSKPAHLAQQLVSGE